MCGKISGVALVAIAALIVNCSAEPHQEQDVNGNEHGSVNQYDGQKLKVMELINLIKAMKEPRYYGPYPATRRFDWNSVVKNPEYNGVYLEGYPKRNFDEIDRSDLDKFVNKRNFDEIDLSMMALPYNRKRFMQTQGRNYPVYPSFRRALDKKMFYSNHEVQPDFKFDEIDLSAMPIAIPHKSGDG